MTTPPDRRRLIVLSQGDYDRMMYSDAASVLVDDFTWVVAVPLTGANAADPELLALLKEYRLTPGTMFVRNRWDGDRFVEVAQAQIQMAMAKYSAIATVCGALGARSMQAVELRFDTSTSATTSKIEIGGSAPLPIGELGNIGVSVDQARRLSEAFEQSFEWHDGGPPDVAAAKEYAERSGLADEPLIRTLIEQRQASVNLLSRYVNTIDLSSDAAREITFAAQLGPVLLRVPGLNLGVEVKNVSQRHFRLTVKVRIEFPDTWR